MQYVVDVQEKNLARKFDNVYVTDHIAQTDKLLTHSEEEDIAFYNAKMKLAAYKAKAPQPVVPKPKRKYELGSLMQRVFDPMAGATKNEEGTLVYEMQDKEIAVKLDEEVLRKQYEMFVNQDAIDGTLEEDDDDLTIAMTEEMANVEDVPIDEFNAYLDQEMSVFKEGERYDYVKDL